MATDAQGGSGTAPASLQPRLVDGDVVVRRFVAADTPALFRAVRASMDSLSYWLPWCHPGYAEADAAKWIEHCGQAWERGTEFPLGIFDSRGALLGGVGLSQVDRSRRLANLGYWVGAPHRGQGIATVAAALAARLAFDALGFERLEIVALPHNLSSRRVAEKLGAVCEGEHPDRVVFQGRPAAAIVYALERGAAR